MFMLSTQNVACDKGISRVELICFLNRKPIAAPMSSSRGMLIAFNGESRVFEPTKRVVVGLSSYLWWMYTAAAYAASEASKNVWREALTAEHWRSSWDADSF